MSNTQIATQQAQQLATIHSYSVAEVKSQVTQVHKLMQELMQENTHYGHSFPGDTKKNLLKPGADKLLFMFRLRPDFEQEIKDLPNGHREVVTYCHIYHIESGAKIADGVGSACTLESKFRWRAAQYKCPSCGKECIKKSTFDDKGYYCHSKMGGCGAKFSATEEKITKQVIGRIENPDIADCYNTVMKMSKKRAYVDATITATAASDIFTQDLEDLAEGEIPMNNVPPACKRAEKTVEAEVVPAPKAAASISVTETAAICEFVKGLPDRERAMAVVAKYCEPKNLGTLSHAQADKLVKELQQSFSVLGTFPCEWRDF